MSARGEDGGGGEGAEGGLGLEDVCTQQGEKGPLDESGKAERERGRKGHGAGRMERIMDMVLNLKEAKKAREP